MKRILYLFGLVMILTACSQTEIPASAPATAVPADLTENIDEEEQPLAEAPRSQPEDEEETTSPDPTAESEPPVSEAPTDETAGIEPTMTAEPIEVTYFTPSQMEGPYYTVDKPEDRDNDLVDFAGATGMPEGQVLHFGGVVYDANGLPAEGITVEIWQTDASGVYLHPQDPGTDGRDPNFQFYGESNTGADGVYSFRTVLPGRYEPRPRHIHVKVKQDGQELLTTQFYFADEINLQGNDAAMLIDTAPAEDDAGNPILVGQRDIILSIPLAD